MGINNYINPNSNSYTNPTPDMYSQMMSWGQQQPGLYNPNTPYTDEGQAGGIPGMSGFNPLVQNIPDVQSRSWFDDAVGTPEQPGYGGLALGAMGGLASTFLGMKQYGLAKDTLAQNKMQFQKNYDSQKTLTNANLEDRQRARVASSSIGAYESVDSYMNKNRIK